MQPIVDKIIKFLNEKKCGFEYDEKHHIFECRCHGWNSLLSVNLEIHPHKRVLVSNVICPLKVQSNRRPALLELIMKINAYLEIPRLVILHGGKILVSRVILTVDQSGLTDEKLEAAIIHNFSVLDHLLPIIAVFLYTSISPSEAMAALEDFEASDKELGPTSRLDFGDFSRN